MAKRDNTREQTDVVGVFAGIEGNNFKTAIESHDRTNGVDAIRQTVGFHPGAGMVSTVSDEPEKVKTPMPTAWSQLISKVEPVEREQFYKGRTVTALLTSFVDFPYWWEGEFCEYPVLQHEFNALRLNTGEIIPL